MTFEHMLSMETKTLPSRALCIRIFAPHQCETLVTFSVVFLEDSCASVELVLLEGNFSRRWFRYKYILSA